MTTSETQAKAGECGRCHAFISAGTPDYGVCGRCGVLYCLCCSHAHMFYPDTLAYVDAVPINEKLGLVPSEEVEMGEQYCEDCDAYFAKKFHLCQ